jgi:hypothetical protein
VLRKVGQVSDEVADTILQSFGISAKDGRLAIEGVSHSAIDPKQPSGLFSKQSDLDLTNPEALRKDQIAHGGWYSRKKMRQNIHDAEHSSHGGKHLKAKTEEQAQQLSFKTAQYLPGLNIPVLEKAALEKGIILPRDGGAFWKFFRFEKPIGYDGGVRTHWIRVEYSSGTYHGHPMRVDRVRKYIKDAKE